MRLRYLLDGVQKQHLGPGDRLVPVHVRKRSTIIQEESDTVRLFHFETAEKFLEALPHLKPDQRRRVTFGPDVSFREKDLRRLSLHNFAFQRESNGKKVGMDFTGANLQGADLSNSDLSKAILRGADFTEADLHRALLKGVKAEGAIFTKTTLSGADLRKGVFDGAIFTHSKTRGVKIKGRVKRILEQVKARIQGAKFNRPLKNYRPARDQE